MYYGSGGQRYRFSGGVVYRNTTAVNAFRILMSSGNIALRHRARLWANPLG